MISNLHNKMIEYYKTKNKHNHSLFIAIIISTLTICFLERQGINNILYCIMIFTNSLIVLYGMFEDSSRPYTLKKFIFLFFFVFFILANAIQFAHNSNVLTFTLYLYESDYLYFQIFTFFTLIFFNFFYTYSFNKLEKSKTPKINISDKKLVIVASIGTLLVLLHFHFNLAQLLFRGLTEDMIREHGVEVQENTSVASDLIFSKIIRSIPWACFIIGKITHKCKNLLLFLFLLMLLTVFPTGLARNAVAMYWIPVFILILSKYIKGSNIICVMLVGLFVIFPFIDNFRHFNGNIEFKFNLDYLDTMNMDASQLYMAVIKSNTITFGNQLLGALFFWVPRSIWTSKPEGSGHFLVHELDGTFSNVSMPFPAEGYINFGFVGIIIFTIILALGSSYMDKTYWKNKVNIKSGYYLILLGAIIFIMRGDLMSSLAFTVGIMLAYYMTTTLTRKFHGSLIKNRRDRSENMPTI